MSNIHDLIKAYRNTYPVPEKKRKRKKESEKEKSEK